MGFFSVASPKKGNINAETIFLDLANTAGPRPLARRGDRDRHARPPDRLLGRQSDQPEAGGAAALAFLPPLFSSSNR